MTARVRCTCKAQRGAGVAEIVCLEKRVRNVWPGKQFTLFLAALALVD